MDSALPSVFKERLFVHLSRFCESRYCVVRHLGFLTGHGRPAGDAAARPETLEDGMALLARPFPGAGELAGSLARLRSLEQARPIPEPGSQAEWDLIDALTVFFLEPRRAEEARQAVRCAVGGKLAILGGFLSFIRTAHYWTESCPELDFEADVAGMLAVTLCGRPAPLSPQPAVALSLVLHELGTNARKYGALSTPGGRVSVNWGTENGTLCLEWAEGGGPPAQRPERGGFGTMLNERSLEGVGGSARLQFDSSGLRCSIHLPLLSSEREKQSSWEWICEPNASW